MPTKAPIEEIIRKAIRTHRIARTLLIMTRIVFVATWVLAAIDLWIHWRYLLVFLAGGLGVQVYHTRRTKKDLSRRAAKEALQVDGAGVFGQAWHGLLIDGWSRPGICTLLVAPSISIVELLFHAEWVRFWVAFAVATHPAWGPVVMWTSYVATQVHHWWMPLQTWLVHHARLPFG